MLLIFTFSITPKRYLHDLVADHTDYYSGFNPGGEPAVNQAGFDCDCDELVVSTPYIEIVGKQSSLEQIAFCSFILSSYSLFITPSRTTNDLRGPPALAFIS